MKKPNRSVLISGGGTGGHIFPAIAIGKALQEKYPDIDIRFVGAKGKMEMQKVPEAGFPIEGLWISGLQRRLTLKNALFPLKILSSLLRANRILRQRKPLAAVGVGGFASGPLLFMASRKGIPTLIQEQNNYPGITNKLLASKVDHICVAFEGMERFFPKEKIELTGNPVREEFLRDPLSKADARAKLGLDPSKTTIFITGGSLGARTINQAVENGLERIAEADIQLIWQTGKFYTNEPSVPGIRSAFIVDMSTAYDASDLVIARAGALTLAELAVKGKACILVPSPNVAEDHQTRNAEALASTGAALLIKDSDASKQLISEAIGICTHPELRSEMEEHIRPFAVRNATERILKLLEPYLEK